MSQTSKPCMFTDPSVPREMAFRECNCPKCIEARAWSFQVSRQKAVVQKPRTPVVDYVSKYEGAIDAYHSRYPSAVKPKHFTLYRFWDSDTHLLYVGMTRTFINRIKMHELDKDWWQDVSMITVEHHGDIDSLRTAELKAIATEKPLYNKADLPSEA